MEFVTKLLDNLLVLKNYKLPEVEQIYRYCIKRVEIYYIDAKQNIVAQIISDFEIGNKLNRVNLEKINLYQ